MRTKAHAPTVNIPSKSIQIKNLQSAHWHFLNQISKTKIDLIQKHRIDIIKEQR